MTIAHEILPAGTLVTVCGESLDVGMIDAFKQQMQPLMSAGTTIILNLEHVLFVDSSALGALLLCQRQLARSHGRLLICNVTAQVRTQFDLVHIQRVMPVYATVADALADAPGPP